MRWEMGSIQTTRQIIVKLYNFRLLNSVSGPRAGLPGPLLFWQGNLMCKHPNASTLGLDLGPFTQGFRPKPAPKARPEDVGLGCLPLQTIPVGHLTQLKPNNKIKL